MEPSLDLSFVEVDEVELEAAAWAMVVGEDLGDDGEALEIIAAEPGGCVEVERR
jgi:hypothetical protein